MKEEGKCFGMEKKRQIVDGFGISLYFSGFIAKTYNQT